MIEVLLSTAIDTTFQIDSDREFSSMRWTSIAQAIDIFVDPRYSSREPDSYAAFSASSYRKNMAAQISKSWAHDGPVVSSDLMLLVTVSHIGTVRKTEFVRGHSGASNSAELQSLIQCVKAQQFRSIPAFCERNDDLMFKFEVSELCLSLANAQRNPVPANKKASPDTMNNHRHSK